MKTTTTWFVVIGRDGLYRNLDGSTEREFDRAQLLTSEQAHKVRAAIVGGGNIVDAFPDEDGEDD